MAEARAIDALADAISEFVFGGLNAYGQPATANKLLLDAVVMLRGIATDALALMPSADVPACRDEGPAQPATLAACYPDPPEYPHPEDDPPDPEPHWEAWDGI